LALPTAVVTPWQVGSADAVPVVHAFTRAAASLPRFGLPYSDDWGGVVE